MKAFSGCYMSDAKWMKLFTHLSHRSELILRCYIKDVSDDALREIKIPSFINFTHTFNNKGINDIPPAGPMLFSHIERIEFPAEFKFPRQMREQLLEPRIIKQDIKQISEYILKIGKFETEFCAEKLIIYGYR